MKNKKTIPIFVPHRGCPNDCIFCNQKKITGVQGEQTKEEIIAIIETALETIDEGCFVEIAFFGGSFTAIPQENQKELLEIAKMYIEAGRVHTIRISTRPDSISLEILGFLKKYNVSIIELGVQSMDEDVLLTANRGHKASCVAESAKLIKENGFKLGLQMMIGLPQDSEDKISHTVDSFVKLKPDFVRIYPVLVIRETELELMLNKGLYKPWEIERAAQAAKNAYKIFTENNIEVIRIGLQASDTIDMGADVVAGPFHPAFGEIVLSLLYRDAIEAYILKNDLASKPSRALEIKTAKKNFSKITGNKKSNKIYFMEKYGISIVITEQSTEALIINEEEIKLYS